jgi:hypothetical protein
MSRWEVDDDTMLQKILDAREDETLLKADGFDAACIGIYDNPTTSKPQLVYSCRRCIEILMKDQGMDQETAEEYFDFNTLGSYVGEQTPVFVEDRFE